MTPTFLFNDNIKQLYCESLGLDNYEWSVYYQGSPKDTVTVYENDREKKFFPIDFEWTKQSVTYRAIVPAKVKSRLVGSFPFKYELHEYDLEAMLEIAKEYIKQ